MKKELRENGNGPKNCEYVVQCMPLNKDFVSSGIFL